MVARLIIPLQMLTLYMLTSWYQYNNNSEVIEQIKLKPQTFYFVWVNLISLSKNKLKQIIKEEVEDPFDHRNLNLDVPDFEELNPTAENISIVIYRNISTLGIK